MPLPQETDVKETAILVWLYMKDENNRSYRVFSQRLTEIHPTVTDAGTRGLFIYVNTQDV